MASCPNCSKKLSCGCQRRTASDGTAVCTNCISTYESANGVKKQSIRTIQKQSAPTAFTQEQINASLNTWSQTLNRFKK